MRPKAVQFSVSDSIRPFYRPEHFTTLLPSTVSQWSYSGAEQFNGQASKRRSGGLLCAFYTQVLFVLESRLALILLVSSVIIVSPFEAAGSAIGTGGGMDSSSS